MSDSASIETKRRELESLIIARAWQDEEFRRKFVETPEVCFAEIGVELPPGFRVQVHEEDGEHIHFVLPYRPGRDIEELSDAELEQVAGGGGANAWDVLNNIVDKTYDFINKGTGGWGKKG